MTDKEKEIIENLEEYLQEEMWRYTEPPLGKEECEIFLKLLKQKEERPKEKNVSDNNVGKWIPVSEGLPTRYEEVLVTDDASGMATIKIDECGEYEVTGERFWSTSQNVTAWMSLPKPYKAESEEK